MQRTYRHQNTIQNIYNHRSSSLHARSPTQVLELIKLKRSSINNGYKNPRENPQSIDYKPLRLCLPKISSTYSSLDIEKPDTHQRVSRGTIHTQHFSLMRRSSESLVKQSPIHLKTELDEVSQDEDDELMEQARCTTVLSDIMRQFPKLNKQKNLQNILPLVQFLTTYNPFFKNLPTTVVFAFLKICKIRQFPKNKWIYRKHDFLSCFYIIMWGKVKIVNVEKKFKKISVKGETLSEQLLFVEYNEINKREEGAKVMSHCFLLEIEYKIYLKLFKELVLKGYKAEFLTMETLIRRNYILKQGIKERNQKLV